MNIFIGIDGGLQGGIAVITKNHTFGTIIPTYSVEVKGKRGWTKRKRYDLPMLRRFFVCYACYVDECHNQEYDVTQCHVTLEEAFPMPAQGIVSQYSVGLGYGIFQGLLTGLGMNYVTVHPKKWQSEFKIRTNEENGSTKDQALAVCEELFPNVNLLASERSTIPHKGIVDAFLIAEYGKRQMEANK